MKNFYGILIAVLALLGVAAGGYWLGTRSAAQSSEPVATKSERKPLYYRNPMGLPDTSPVPKKDAMGMDYVPVYEGDEPASSTVVTIGTDKVQKLGVKSEAVGLRVLDKTLRAVGRIEIDERRTFVVAPKFEGWVERLYVNTTGQAVGKGQPLFEVYSPELLSARRERELAAQGIAALKDADDEARDGMRRLAESSAARLKNWDIADGRVNGNRVTFHAPVAGVVLEKRAVQGMRFMPGEELYRIADLSTVWVVADIAEQDIAGIKAGDAVRVRVDAYPEQRFDGKIAFVYPTLNSSTRTVQVRAELANPKGLFKPAMFAQVELPVGGASPVPSVPVSAVIDSGIRQVVLVQLAEGRFEPRTVTLGVRGDDYVEVLSGVDEGEQVVTAANFLIDAESNLRAALGGMGGQAVKAASAAENPSQPSHAPARSAPVGSPLLRSDSSAVKGGAGETPQLGKKSKPVGHEGQGMLEAVNADGTVSITHEPIESLGWPGMTMDFELANSSLAQGIEPGSAISFEIVERGEGVWVITRMQAAKPASHEGH